MTEVVFSEQPIVLKLKDLEASINAYYKSDFKSVKKPARIKRNVLCAGSDTSVHATGFTLIETTATDLLIHFHAKLNIKKVIQEIALLDFIGKAEILYAKIEELFEDTKVKTKVLVLEDTYLGPNVLAFKLLTRVGGMLLMCLSQLFTNLKILTPVGARSSVGFNSKLRTPETKKEKTKDLVMVYIKNLTGIEFTDDDLCDSFVLALAGVIE